jgi:MFS family permease
MDRRSAFVLLGVCALASFLAGLELMVTAVALPAIVTSLADWGELRLASWIVNGYLLVSIVTMPLAGRVADRVGVRPVLLAGLAIFALGSALSGAAPSLGSLVAARCVQAVGAGILVPVATAGASHLFDGRARPRALGIVGASTFLGMAAGPFVGAAVLRSVHPAALLEALGWSGGILEQLTVPAWRWVFYLNVPFALAALMLAWAAAAGWETPRRRERLDLVGAALVTGGLGSLLVGLTLIGDADAGNLLRDILPAVGDEATTVLPAVLVAVGLLALAGAVVRGIRRPDAFLEVRAFRIPAFAGATLVSLLTGYGFATAIIGAAVVVDRVRYGGPAEQQTVLGSLAAATAIGALVSGWLVHRLSVTVVAVVGLLACSGGLALMATWDPSTSVPAMAGALTLVGLGFGATVTPRSTAAVEALGQRAFGAASSTVTVARMAGMAVGLAVLTAYGSTTIDRLTSDLFGTPDGWRTVLPPELAGRPLEDGLVVQALEAWAAAEAAKILGGVFLIAAGTVLVAIPPALAMGRTPRMLRSDGVPARDGEEVTAPEASGDGTGEPSLVL